MRKILLLLFLVPVLLCSCEKERDAKTHYGIVYLEDTPEGQVERRIHFTGSKNVSYRYSEFLDHTGTIMIHRIVVTRYNSNPFLSTKQDMNIESVFPLHFVRFEPYAYWASEKYINKDYF